MNNTKRLTILEQDQQDLRTHFSFLRGEFKALKWIAGSLWLPALGGLGMTVWDHLFK